MSYTTLDCWGTLPRDIQIYTLARTDLETLKRVSVASKAFRELALEAGKKLQERLLPRLFKILLGHERLYIEKKLGGGGTSISLKVNLTNVKLTLSTLSTVSGNFNSYTLTFLEGKPVSVLREYLRHSDWVSKEDLSVSEINTFIQRIQTSLDKASISDGIIPLKGLGEYLHV